MANWAAIGALGTAAEGAGNYFGIIGAEKIKSQRLAEARADKLADKKDDRLYQDGVRTNNQKFQTQEAIDASTRSSNEFDRREGLKPAAAEAARQAETDFDLANPTHESQFTNNEGFIVNVDSNGDHHVTDTKDEEGKGVPVAFKMEGTLKKDVAALDKSLGFTEAQAAIVKLRYAREQGNSISDAAMIFNFMKTLDPGSVVRESEFRTIEDARAFMSKQEALGIPIPSAIQQTMQSLSGEGKLLPSQRQQMMDVAEASWSNTERQMSQKLSTVKQRANEYGINLDNIGYNDYSFGEVQGDPVLGNIDNRTGNDARSSNAFDAAANSLFGG